MVSVAEAFAGSDDGKGTDGAELTLFVWREFCEKAEPPLTQGPSVAQAIDMVRRSMCPIATARGLSGNTLGTDHE